MEVFLGILIAVGWIVGVVISRIITTFIHELGHAIPALMFTPGEVQIHVGSYGDTQNSYNLNLGRLKTCFKFDVLNWNIGLCSHHGTPTIWQTLMIILGGPVFSLSIGIVLLWVISWGTWNDTWIFIFSAFILGAVFDFFVNIIPANQPVGLHDGTPAYNDGKALQQLIRQSKFPDDFFKASELLQEKKYADAAVLYEKIVTEGFDKKEIRLGWIESLSKSGNFEKAFEQIEILKSKKQFKTRDHAWLGDIFLEKKEYLEAVNNYSKYLYKFFEDARVLNNRGYSLLQLAEYQKAFNDFNSALIYQPDFAAAYAHRGLVKIRIGDLVGSWEDLKLSRSLNDRDPYVYLYLGYYFQEKNDRAMALNNFQKAKAMGIDFHGIDFLIETI